MTHGQNASARTTLGGGPWLNAWICDCGDHRIEDSQPASMRALQDHLAATGHRGGEYFYGCQDQRTTVRVTADADGRFTHELAS